MSKVRNWNACQRTNGTFFCNAFFLSCLAEFEPTLLTHVDITEPVKFHNTKDSKNYL